MNSHSLTRREKAKHTCFPKAGAKVLQTSDIHKFFIQKTTLYCKINYKRLIIRHRKNAHKEQQRRYNTLIEGRQRVYSLLSCFCRPFYVLFTSFLRPFYVNHIYKAGTGTGKIRIKHAKTQKLTNIIPYNTNAYIGHTLFNTCVCVTRVREWNMVSIKKYADNHSEYLRIRRL